MKIKIIDLLNMNENKLPNRIQVFNTAFENFKKNYYAISGDYQGQNLLDWVHDADDLNEQVEIIEEDKKIEKLKIKDGKITGSWENGSIYNYTLSAPQTVIVNKINELIDEVNKLKENK